jgi:broad specificity phosphatase PhoE
MNRIYLIRHAECLANLSPEIISGGNDTPLTPRGKLQAMLLGQRFQLEGIIFDEVHSSELIRPQQTAKIAIPGASLIISQELNEMHQGDFLGKNRQEIYKTYGEQIARENWYFRTPNGQSQDDVAQNMFSWLKKYGCNGENKKIGAFSHGYAIKSLLTLILDRDKELSWKKSIANTSISEIIYDGKFHVARENDYTHLPREDVLDVN